MEHLSPRSPHAFVSVNTQFENLGDALITRELIRQLSTRLPTIVDCSRCPPDFLRALNLQELEGVKVRQNGGLGSLILEMLKHHFSCRNAYYFLLPGGLGGGRSAKQYVLGYINSVLLRLLKSVGIRICQVGVSYDHLDKRYAGLLRKRVPALYSHAVRDVFSQQHVAELGIRVDQIVPDLAFGLFANPSAIQRGGDAIAFSFRADKHKHRKSDIENLVRTLLAKAGGVTVKFVAQVGRDAPFMNELAQLASQIPGVNGEVHVCVDDIERCRSIYSDCAVIYSNRLHALLLGMSAGAVPVAIVDRRSDMKIVGVFDSMGLADQVVDLGELPPGSSLKLKLEGAVANCKKVSEYFDRVLSVGARQERFRTNQK